MKKWLKFFFLGFFSHKSSKQGVKRGYGNVLLGFVLALVLLWASFMGADILPFGIHYKNSSDFAATAHAVFANSDSSKRIDAKIENGVLMIKNGSGEYGQDVLINTFESESDKQNYSVNGYNVIVDTRPADTLAEFEAYCVSNDGKDTVISYEDYLTLSDVAKLNFDFKLKYTGNELRLNDEYINALIDEYNLETENLKQDLAENKITKSEYNREVYELFFVNYYPEISAYESTSKVPLLRNYYYHNYTNEGEAHYLFVFNDCMVGSFETKNGIDVSFYGFYSGLENGTLISDDMSQKQAESSVDDFIKSSFKAIGVLNSYFYFMNVISFAPFVVLMVMVATLLAYSIFKLCSIGSVINFGSMFKIVGSFILFSGVISAVLNVIISFFINSEILNVLPLVLFFAVIMVRAVMFAIKEGRISMKEFEEREAEKTEV